MKNLIAKRVKMIVNDFEVIKGIRDNVSVMDLTQTLLNLQVYQSLKANYLKELNKLQLEAVHVMDKIQYVKFKHIIETIQREL